VPFFWLEAQISNNAKNKVPKKATLGTKDTVSALLNNKILISQFTEAISLIVYHSVSFVLLDEDPRRLDDAAGVIERFRIARYAERVTGGLTTTR